MSFRNEILINHPNIRIDFHQQCCCSRCVGWRRGDGGKTTTSGAGSLLRPRPRGKSAGLGFPSREITCRWVYESRGCVRRRPCENENAQKIQNKTGTGRRRGRARPNPVAQGRKVQDDLSLIQTFCCLPATQNSVERSTLTSDWSWIAGNLCRQRTRHSKTNIYFSLNQEADGPFF